MHRRRAASAVAARREPVREQIMTVDYKATIFLPKTDFPMRGGLAKKEPEILANWESLDLFGRLRAQSAEQEKFKSIDVSW